MLHRLIPDRYLAIDIGGTNLRVGFIALSQFGEEEKDMVLSNGISEYSRLHTSRIRRLLEKSWPIGEYLKHEKAEDLFAWIGECIAEVVEDGVQTFGAELPNELPMGVTFSFPMMYGLDSPQFGDRRLITLLAKKISQMQP